MVVGRGEIKVYFDIMTGVEEFIANS